MNIADIQKHVTYFSEELSSRTQHQEEVVIGGKIVAMVHPVEDSFPQYILMLDDLVGITHVYLPEEVFNAHAKELQIGNLVFFEGISNIVERTINKEKVREVSICAYAMKDVSSEEQ